MWFHMANITLYIPDDLKRKMDEHKEMRWSMAIRTIIEQKLGELEEFERLVKKSRLTEKEAMTIADKINEAAGKHAEALLNEARSRR